MSRIDPFKNKRGLAVCTEQKIKGVDFTHDRFRTGEYEKCSFLNCVFSNIDLSNAVFNTCDFHSCDLSLAKVVNTAFRMVKFQDCKLLGVRFEVCNNFLLTFEFENCNLDMASFYKLSVARTIFRTCSLHEADLSEANLTQAVFENCDLAGAIFGRTVLESADFTNAFNFSIDPENNRIRKARFSATGLAGLLHKYNLEIEDK